MMIYIVETNFSIGIFLSKIGIEYNAYTKDAIVTQMEDYREALKIVLEKSEGTISEESFLPNRLYSIKSKNIFSVVYDWRNVGFSKTDEIGAFIQKYELGHKKLVVRNYLDYMEATGLVISLGAITGKGKIFMTKSPKEGQLYSRF